MDFRSRISNYFCSVITYVFINLPFIQQAYIEHVLCAKQCSRSLTYISAKTDKDP